MDNPPEPPSGQKKDTAVLCPVEGDEAERFKINKHGKIKFPRRLIHCSDGVLEEYSTDEEDEEPPPPPPVDTSKLTWLPYFWYHTVKAAYGGLTVCDYLGEKLAYFFGITSPKFQYALTELERLKEEDKEEEEIRAEEIRAEQQIIKEATRMPQFHRLQMGDNSNTTDKGPNPDIQETVQI